MLRRVSIPRSLRSRIRLALNVHNWGTSHPHFFTSKLIWALLWPKMFSTSILPPCSHMVCEWRPEVVVLEEDIQIWHRVTHTCRLKCFTRLSRPHLQYWLSEQILIQLQPPSKKIALIIFLLSETRTPTQEIHRKNYPSCSASTRLTEFRIGSRIAQMSTLVTVTGGSRLTLRVCFTHNYGFRAMTS